MAKIKRGDSFIVQAGILAGAGIVVRIIGILYRSPLTSIIGDEGNGYYGTAYNIYTIILLLASYSIPSAISKVIAQKLALNEYRNAHRIFQCAFIYVIVVGGAASILTYLFAGYLVDENAVTVLRIFTPTIFFSGILGVFRGYYQAHGSMVQTSLSQILEQVLNAVISILAAWLLVRGAAAGTDRAVRGAMGSAMGTGAGVITALLFMIIIYRSNSSFFRRRMARDTSGAVLGNAEIFRMIFMVVTPFILSTFAYNCSTPINQTIYINVMKSLKGLNSAEAATLYGIYSGKSLVILNIPIAISAAVSAAVIPAVSAAFARKETEDTKEKIATAVQATMIIAIPAAVGLAVLAKPVTQLLFPQPESLDLAASLLRALSITVVFYSLSTLTNAVLQGIGLVNRPVIHAVAALVVQTAALVPLLILTELNLYSMVLATVIYTFIMCLLNQITVARAIGYRQEMMRSFILPGISAAVMGGVAWASYSLLYGLFGSNVIALAASIAVAVIVYFAVVLGTGAVGSDTLAHMPGGRTLSRIAGKLRLLRG